MLLRKLQLTYSEVPLSCGGICNRNKILTELNLPETFQNFLFHHLVQLDHAATNSSWVSFFQYQPISNTPLHFTKLLAYLKNYQWKLLDKRSHREASRFFLTWHLYSAIKTQIRTDNTRNEKTHTPSNKAVKKTTNTH